MIGAQHSSRYSKNLPVVPQHFLVASTGALLVVCDTRIPPAALFGKGTVPKTPVTLNTAPAPIALEGAITTVTH